MMNKSVCIIDGGFFVSLATRLREEFETVYYFCNWESGYPRLKDSMVGTGLDGVTKIDTIGELLLMKDEIDLFVFPDCYFSSLAEYLKQEGHLVFGMGETSWLELDRTKLRLWQKSENMDVPQSEIYDGLDDLRENVQEERFIKISKFRGDMETLKHYDDITNEQCYDEIAVRLGCGKNEIEFIGEEKIEGIEVGLDTYTVDGKYPETMLYGWEVKDQIYFGKIGYYPRMPKPITMTTEKLKKIFEKESSRGFFSTENRVTKDGKSYLIDFTARMPNPPYQLHLKMIKNLGEIMYEGAKGNLIEPKWNAKYGAVAIITSEAAELNAVPLQISEESEAWTTIMCSCKVDETLYTLPIYGLSEIGAVCGIGDTLEEAIKNCKDHAKGVKGYKVEIEILTFNEVDALVSEGKNYDINF